MINSLLKLLNDVLADEIKDERKCDENECCDCCCCDDECDCCSDDMKLDLKDNKDYGLFKKIVNDIREDLKNDEMAGFYKLLLGDDVKSTLDKIDDIADELHGKEKKKTPELPSSKLNVQQKEQIHKIVGEYVDTVIRPNTDMDTKVINDVYAGLFEFACWILNK